MNDNELVEGRRVLLSELRYEHLDIIESEDGPAKIRCIATIADEVNQNGRLYPKAIWEREIKKANETLARRPGLANHPGGTSKLENIAILWTEFSLDGNKVIASGNLVPTRIGQDVEAIARSGVEVGVSSRGYGSIKKETRNGQEVAVIQDDYEFVTCDLVCDPSVDDARITSIESIDTLTIDTLADSRPDIVDEIEVDALETLIEKKWDRVYINSLPDIAFAIVLPGGEKDDEGKTKPRSLRKLPHHNETVKDPNEKDSVDLPHLRNALARVSQMKGVTDEQRAKAQAHLDKHKAQFDMSDSLERNSPLNDTDNEQLATVTAELTEANARNEEVSVQLAEAASKITELTAQVDDAQTKAAEVAVQLDESNAKLADATAKLVEVEAARTLLAEDAANIKTMVDLCAKEIKEKASDKDFYGAATMSYMGSEMQYMHDRDIRKSMEALAAEAESLVTSLGVHNLHGYIREKCRPERYSWPLADALVSTCKTREEVDAKFDEIKARVESEQIPTRPSTRGEAGSEQRLSSVDAAALEKIREMRGYR